MSTNAGAEFRPTKPRLVAGFDGHRPAPIELLDRAAAEADLRSLPLLLLSVLRPAGPPGSPTSAAIRRDLENSLAAVRLGHPHLEVDAACVAEADLERETGLLQSAAVLSLGLNDRAGRPPFEPGSTSRLLLEAVTCPVLLLPDSREAPVGARDRSERFVLVGVGSDDEDVVPVRVALTEAGRRGLDVHVLHAEARGADIPDRGDLTKVRDLVSRARAGVRSEISISVTLTTEPPDSALARYAHDAELLVVGTRPGSLTGLVDGSVGHGLISRATDAGCAVLLVPRPPAPQLFPRPPYESGDARSPALSGRRSHE